MIDDVGSGERENVFLKVIKGGDFLRHCLYFKEIGGFIGRDKKELRSR